MSKHAVRGGDVARLQLQDGSLAEGVGDNLEATALLDEQTLKQIRRADRAAVGDRESQVRDAGFEVVHEAGNRSVVLAAIIGNDPGRELARNGSAWRPDRPPAREP